MTPTLEILETVKKAGGILEPAGDKLRMLLPADVSPALKEAIRQHKAELMEALSKPRDRGWQAVPPYNLRLHTTMPAPSPENREQVISFMLRQGADKAGKLTIWLVKRQDAYFESIGAKWDCGIICYAAARDSACWQLNKSEREVWDFLEATEEISRQSHKHP